MLGCKSEANISQTVFLFVRVSFARVIALGILARHFLIASTTLGFAASLVCLWSTSLLFPIVARRLSFAVFRLLTVPFLS